MTVPKTQESAHPVVRRVAALLARTPLDQHQCLAAPGGCFNVTVEAHKRALLILDALCKGLEARGHVVELVSTESKPHHHVVASVRGELVAFSVSERLERTEHKRTDDEQQLAAKGHVAGIPKKDRWPGGRLRIDVLESRLARALWSDTDMTPGTLGENSTCPPNPWIGRAHV